MNKINLELENLEQLEEIKRAINSIIAERLKYSTLELEKHKQETNDHYLQLDYKLLDKVIKIKETEENN